MPPRVGVAVLSLSRCEFVGCTEPLGQAQLPGPLQVPGPSARPGPRELSRDGLSMVRVVRGPRTGL